MVGIIGADREQPAEENLRGLMLVVKLFALIGVDKDGTRCPIGASRELKVTTAKLLSRRWIGWGVLLAFLGLVCFVSALKRPQAKRQKPCLILMM